MCRPQKHENAQDACPLQVYSRMKTFVSRFHRTSLYVFFLRIQEPAHSLQGSLGRLVKAPFLTIHHFYDFYDLIMNLFGSYTGG